MANAANSTQGQTAVTTTAAQLSTGQSNSASGLYLYALSGNTSTVYVGHSSSLATSGANIGFPLEPGKGLQVNVNNIDELWVISGGGSQSVGWMSA